MQKYVFQQVLSIFGKDIAKNIFILFTFADSKRPSALHAVDAEKVPFVKYFKLNNSAFFPDDQDDKELGIELLYLCFDWWSLHIKIKQTFEKYQKKKHKISHISRLFWKMGMKSFENLFNHISNIEPKSLSLTREVLEER